MYKSTSSSESISDQVAAPRRAMLRAMGLACLLAVLPLASSESLAQQGKGISSGQAANIARNATGGKVLSVSPAGAYFRVKVLKRNGVVTNVRVNRTTGRVSR